MVFDKNIEKCTAAAFHQPELLRAVQGLIPTVPPPMAATLLQALLVLFRNGTCEALMRSGGICAGSGSRGRGLGSA